MRYAWAVLLPLLMFNTHDSGMTSSKVCVELHCEIIGKLIRHRNKCQEKIPKVPICASFYFPFKLSTKNNKDLSNWLDGVYETIFPISRSNYKSCLGHVTQKFRAQIKEFYFATSKYFTWWFLIKIESMDKKRVFGPVCAMQALFWYFGIQVCIMGYIIW